MVQMDYGIDNWTMVLDYGTKSKFGHIESDAR